MGRLDSRYRVAIGDILVSLAEVQISDGAEGSKSGTSPCFRDCYDFIPVSGTWAPEIRIFFTVLLGPVKLFPDQSFSSFSLSEQYKFVSRRNCENGALRVRTDKCYNYLIEIEKLARVT